MSEIEIFQKLKEVINEEAALRIAQVITEAIGFYEKMATKDDIKELRDVLHELAEAQRRTEEKVADLAEAQKKTEQRLSTLEEKMAELADAQRRTEERVNELAEAQRRTEERVNQLAEAQRKTEQRLATLEEKMAELADAQRRTEERVNELAEAQRKTEQRLSTLEEKMAELADAQRRTEERVNELAEAQRKTEGAILELTKGLRALRKEFGGFSRTMSYAFENEAFRHLPLVLSEKYNIKIEKKFIRQEIGGKEINIFAKAQKDGKEIYIIGESKLRLEEKEYHQILSDLEEKEEAVREEYGDVEIIKILVTHYAKKGFLKKAEGENLIIVQSFEW